MSGTISKMNLMQMSPREVRQLIRQGDISGQTSGMCAGYAQANLVILPEREANDFLLFATKNPRSCPLLEVTEKGSRKIQPGVKGKDHGCPVTKV